MTGYDRTVTTPRLCGRCGAPVPAGAVSCAYCNVSFEVPPGAARAPAPGADPAVVESLRRGNKIEAIRLYRLATKSSLLDAKNAVEALERSLGLA